MWNHSGEIGEILLKGEKGFLPYSWKVFGTTQYKKTKTKPNKQDTIPKIGQTRRKKRRNSVFQEGEEL
jgi:hypothetical protein